jgi:multiple sugar transport system substrate-binding protein
MVAGERKSPGGATMDGQEWVEKARGYIRSWGAQLAASGWIVDLSDRFTQDTRADFLPGSVEAITFGGKAFGVAWFTDTGFLYYRKDLLEKSGFDGPPKSWDELKMVALHVKEDSGTKYGFVFQGANYEGGVCNGCEGSRRNTSRPSW